MSHTYRMGKGLVDYQTPVRYHFDNTTYMGYKGDTLASALLANGVRLVGRSFKYHRPRGILSAGYEEPNALVTLHKTKAFKEPNVLATKSELFDGMQAYSQNYRGTLKYDFLAVNDYISPILSAGFYYKTFMWPKSFWEKVYEPIIRNAAGLGKLSGISDPSSYEKGFLHCDLLVIGGGIAGLQSTLVAGLSGLRVLLVHDDFIWGGHILTDTASINSCESFQWIQETIKQLESLPNVQLMKRSTVFGVYDHGVYGVLERLNDHISPALTMQQPRHILWRVYAKRSLLCAGSTERLIPFNNNDRPGIMLANSVLTYAKRYGVACGRNIIIYTNNDSGWKTAKDLCDMNFPVKAVIDSRSITPRCEIKNIDVYLGRKIVTTSGRHSVSSVTLDDKTIIHSDCVGVSGGWNPTLHLSCHHRSRPKWDEGIASFIPDIKNLPEGMSTAGSVNGYMGAEQVYKDAFQKVGQIIKDLGFKKKKIAANIIQEDIKNYTITPCWVVNKSIKAFVDLQNDVTVKDIQLSCQEGFHSVEHLKRYTTLGMATDQGKTSNVNAIGLLSQQLAQPAAQVGTTIYRPPYTSIPIASLAGRYKGKHYRPYRLPPSHQWAKERGAIFVEAGLWLRAQWYPLPKEDYWRESVDREVMATRNSVGVCDVSTLGKIDIKGIDSAAFLNNVYANNFAKLTIGKVRYGLMLREDGMVMDDGTTARLSDTHYIMTTTTANAGSVFRHLEFCRQCLYPHMDVHLQSITDYCAQYAIAGPNSRILLQRLIDPQFDISNEAFPFMACQELTICNGIPARLYRISFSGELAYEISVAARYGDALIRLLMTLGEDLHLTPYGTEALGVMRVEKGHPAGNELNGQISAHHLGMKKLLSQKKDFIGKTLAYREGLTAADGLRLVGVRPKDPSQRLYAGAHFVEKNKDITTENDQGWISSVVYSPIHERYIGLGFLQRGTHRITEKIRAISLVHNSDVEVEIVHPVMFDPKGSRMHG